MKRLHTILMLVAVALFTLWLAIQMGYWCVGLCPHLHQCQHRCLDADYCPYGSEP